MAVHTFNSRTHTPLWIQGQLEINRDPISKNKQKPQKTKNNKNLFHLKNDGCINLKIGTQKVFFWFSYMNLLQGN